MGKHHIKKETIIEKPAGELVMQLAAMGNFPAEKAAVEALAKCLQRAAEDTGIRMQAIVDECLASGAWCPTPYDMRMVATSMKDKIREKREGSKHAEWERIYGKPDPDWSTKMVEAAMLRGGHQDAKRAIHEQAIRDMLYYTEGDGKLLGDREYWEGPRRDGLLSAREYDLRNHRELVDHIRNQGGWRTERELQGFTETIK